MKKTQVIILKATFLAAWSVLLLTVCGNEFISDAEVKHNDILGIGKTNSPSIAWGGETIVYINPINGNLSGTISGKINSYGNKIWFADDLSNPDVYNRRWRFEPPLGFEEVTDGIVPPKILEKAIVGEVPTSSDDREVITLIFGTVVVTDDVYELAPDGKEYSFILEPSAFKGADFNKLSAETKTLNFSVKMPSKTDYVKHEIEKADYYETITVAWDDASGPEGLKDVAASVVAERATEMFKEIMTASGGDELTEINFPGAGTAGFLPGNVVWVSPPDLSKGHWFGTSTLKFGAINAAPDDGEADSDPVQISFQFNFKTDVGDAIIAIKEAEDAGDFSATSSDTLKPGQDIIPRTGGSVAVWAKIDGLVGGLAYTETSSPPLNATLKKGTHNLEIELESGVGAPSDTVSFKIVVP